jgi:hypothetical protein
MVSSTWIRAVTLDWSVLRSIAVRFMAARRATASKFADDLRPCDDLSPALS